ncbi:hypothetical protein EDB83DRAFT_2314684 [Lactarius deliciosus]|nr:hypothetical protein EDB83DRAFT_2314684 [Lactarius deliciosus]
MPSPSTTSLILLENRRVTRSMTKLTAQGCATAVIVRRPLAERTASVNLEAPLPVARKSSPVNRPAAKPPLPHKAGFGFTLGGSTRTPEERERLRKERLAFFRRGGAYQDRKDLPAVKVWVASASSRDRYEREFVGRAGFYRIVPSPAFLAPPATNYRDQVLSPDMFFLVPGVRELAPHEWDEWRPEHNRVVDASKLFVPLTCSSGNLSPDDLKRYFPREWYTARAAEIRKARVGKKRRARHNDSSSAGFSWSRSQLSVHICHFPPPRPGVGVRRTAHPRLRRATAPTPHKGPQVSKRRLIICIQRVWANAQAPFQVAWSVLKLAVGCGLPPSGAQFVSLGRIAPLLFGDFIFFSLSITLADLILPIVDIFRTFGQDVIGVSACKAQEVHSGRGCIFSLAKSTPGTGQCRFDARCTQAEGVRRRLSGWCSGALVVPWLIALFGGIIREQGPLAPSSRFLPVMMDLIWMHMAPQVLPRQLYLQARSGSMQAEIRRVSTSWAKEYTLAERGFSLISRPAPDYTLAEGCALALAPEHSQALYDLSPKAGPTLRTGLLGNGGAPWPRVCPSLLMRTALDASRGISRTGCGRKSRPSRRRTLSGREMRSVSCDVSFLAFWVSRGVPPSLLVVASHRISNVPAGPIGCSHHSLIDQTAGARMRRACSITVRGAGSEWRPSSRKVHNPDPDTINDHWGCRGRNIAIDYGDLSVSSFRTYGAWGPTTVPGLDWLSGHFQYAPPPSTPSPALALTSVVRRIATAAWDGRQCRPMATGCAPDQDFELPGSVQGPAPLTGLPDCAWFYSVDRWDLLVLSFSTDCLRVLSFS